MTVSVISFGDFIFNKTNWIFLKKSIPMYDFKEDIEIIDHPGKKNKDTTNAGLSCCNSFSAIKVFVEGIFTGQFCQKIWRFVFEIGSHVVCYLCRYIRHIITYTRTHIHIMYDITYRYSTC